MTIAFGAAAIKLNRTREELNIPLPYPIVDDRYQCIALIYQIRNAFAHDIAEPTWQINERYRREYAFRELHVDLTNLDGVGFQYGHIGGPDEMFRIKDFFAQEFIPHE